MQIVIDIPEEMWDWLHNGFLDEDDGKHAINAILNGTPLPKGHGDLIDRKELLKQPMNFANYPSNYVYVAPTIIEADRVESDG